jgi:hypothetical protein
MATSTNRSSRASFFSNNWRVAFARVLEETDTNELFRRVEIAEAAMLLRYEALRQGSQHDRERRTLERALDQLGRLKRERLGFPGEISWPEQSRTSHRRKQASARRA